MKFVVNGNADRKAYIPSTVILDEHMWILQDRTIFGRNIFHITDRIITPCNRLLIGEHPFLTVARTASRVLSSISKNDLVHFYKDPVAEEITYKNGKKVAKRYPARVSIDDIYITIESPDLGEFQEICFVPDYEYDKEKIIGEVSSPYTSFIGVGTGSGDHLVSCIPSEDHIRKSVLNTLTKHLQTYARGEGWYSPDNSTYNYCKYLDNKICLSVRIVPPDD